MSVCLLLIDDGREDYLSRCLASLNPLNTLVSSIVLVQDNEHDLGFDGAIREGWDRVREVVGCHYVFHVESDFVFLRPPPLAEMRDILNRDPSVVQVALKRQPWNEVEHEAGGIVEANPAAYEERHLDEASMWQREEPIGLCPYTVHRKFFTTNPSLYRASLCGRGWPEGPESEGRFGISLFEYNPELVSAFYGGKFDPPMVEHIGRQRAGVGY
jgi:hypothetical protein